MRYHCIACRSTTGVPASNGEETWYWVVRTDLNLRFGPFCSRSCSDALENAEVERVLRLIFGSVERAEWLRWLWEHGKLHGAAEDQTDGIDMEFAESSICGPCPVIEDMQALAENRERGSAHYRLQVRPPAPEPVEASPETVPDSAATPRG